jgi:hypothetical protein
MKIPLVGPSSEARSLTSDAQRSINMYTESGGTKSPKGFYGKPGIRNRKTLAGTATCLASVNDRLFCTANNALLELDPNFNTVQNVTGLNTSINPAAQRDRIVLNGLPRHLQALVVANGYAYSWDDQQPYVDSIKIGDVKTASGHCDTDGTAVHSYGTPFGDAFRGAMVNQAIWLNGTAYVVQSIDSDTQLTLTTDAGTMSNADYKAQPQLSGQCDADGFSLHNDGPATGDLFDILMMGQQITVNSANYYVEFVSSDGYDITLSTAVPGVATKNLPWNGIIHLAGKCDVNGTNVTSKGPVNEDLFPGWLVNQTINIGAVNYTVSQVIGPYDLSLTTAATTDFAQAWTATSPPLLAGKCDTDGVAVHNNGPESVLDKDGNPVADLFDPVGMGGQQITINHVNYTVDYVISGWDLLLTTPAPVQKGVDWVANALILQASSACEIGGYAVVTRPNSRQFNISNLNDFSTWDPLDFALKEGSTDNLVGCISYRGELWLFGTENIEVWDLQANPDFPLIRNPSGSIARGLGGAQTLCQVGETALVFIGNDGIAYMTSGLALRPISTHAQENDWRQEFRTAIGFSYEMLGHLMWQINLSGKTWVWDATENEWTERAYWTGSAYQRDIPQFHDYVLGWTGTRVGNDEGTTQGTHVVSGYADSLLYEMSTDFHDDDGVAIRCLRRFPHLVNEKLKVFLHRLTFELESGTVNTGDPEPQMQLRISTDGGRTWRQAATGGDLIVTGGMGLNGDTRKRVIFRRLGSGRDLVPEIAITSKAKIYIADAYGEITAGNA